MVCIWVVSSAVVIAMLSVILVLMDELLNVYGEWDMHYTDVTRAYRGDANYTTIYTVMAVEGVHIECNIYDHAIMLSIRYDLARDEHIVTPSHANCTTSIETHNATSILSVDRRIVGKWCDTLVVINTDFDTADDKFIYMSDLILVNYAVMVN